MTVDENTFENLVLEQVRLLRAGQVLRAFDLFYDDAVHMFDNDKPFATDEASARAIQAGFIE